MTAPSTVAATAAAPSADPPAKKQKKDMAARIKDFANAADYNGTAVSKQPKRGQGHQLTNGTLEVSQQASTGKASLCFKYQETRGSPVAATEICKRVAMNRMSQNDLRGFTFTFKQRSGKVTHYDVGNSTATIQYDDDAAQDTMSLARLYDWAHDIGRFMKTPEQEQRERREAQQARQEEEERERQAKENEEREREAKENEKREREAKEREEQDKRKQQNEAHDKEMKKLREENERLKAKNEEWKKKLNNLYEFVPRTQNALTKIVEPHYLNQTGIERLVTIGEWTAKLGSHSNNFAQNLPTGRNIQLTQEFQGLAPHKQEELRKKLAGVKTLLDPTIASFFHQIVPQVRIEECGKVLGMVPNGTLKPQVLTMIGRTDYVGTIEDKNGVILSDDDHVDVNGEPYQLVREKIAVTIKEHGKVLGMVPNGTLKPQVLTMIGRMDFVGTLQDKNGVIVSDNDHVDVNCEPYQLVREKIAVTIKEHGKVLGMVPNGTLKPQVLTMIGRMDFVGTLQDKNGVIVSDNDHVDVNCEPYQLVREKIPVTVLKENLRTCLGKVIDGDTKDEAMQRLGMMTEYWTIRDKNHRALKENDKLVKSLEPYYCVHAFVDVLWREDDTFFGRVCHGATRDEAMLRLDLLRQYPSASLTDKFGQTLSEDDKVLKALEPYYVVTSKKRRTS